MRIEKYIILLLLINGCASVNKNSNENIQKIDDIINGSRTIINEKTNVIQSGNYKNGFKEGIWLYEIDSSKFEVEWNVYQKDKLLLVNKPNNWDVVDLDITAFSAKGRIKNDTSQVIIVHNINLENDPNLLNDYRRKMSLEFAENYDLLEENQKCFRNNEKTFLISQFHFLNDNEMYHCYNLLNEENHILTEVTYFFKSEEWKIHYNIFLDFVNGIRYSNNFLTNHKEAEFSPLDFIFCKN